MKILLQNNMQLAKATTLVAVENLQNLICCIVASKLPEAIIVFFSFSNIRVPHFIFALYSSLWSPWSFVGPRRRPL